MCLLAIFPGKFERKAIPLPGRWGRKTEHLRFQTADFIFFCADIFFYLLTLTAQFFHSRAGGVVCLGGLCGEDCKRLTFLLEQTGILRIAGLIFLDTAFAAVLVLLQKSLVPVGIGLGPGIVVVIADKADIPIPVPVVLGTPSAVVMTGRVGKLTPFIINPVEGFPGFAVTHLHPEFDLVKADTSVIALKPFELLRYRGVFAFHFPEPAV